MDDETVRRLREAQVAAEVARDTQAHRDRIAELDRQRAASQQAAPDVGSES